jgi:hypothetical protein
MGKGRSKEVRSKEVIGAVHAHAVFHGRSAEQEVDVELIAPHVGKMVCPECDGDPEAYVSRFPPELLIECHVPGIGPSCVTCKGRRYVLVSI